MRRRTDRLEPLEDQRGRGGRGPTLCHGCRSIQAATGADLSGFKPPLFSATGRRRRVLLAPERGGRRLISGPRRRTRDGPHRSRRPIRSRPPVERGGSKRGFRANSVDAAALDSIGQNHALDRGRKKGARGRRSGIPLGGLRGNPPLSGCGAKPATRTALVRVVGKLDSINPDTVAPRFVLACG